MSIKCVNAKKINEYGLYEYFISSTDRRLISTLWDYKAKDCLKYVDNKKFSDKLVVSVGKKQFDNFKNMLDTLSIEYDVDDLCGKISFDNNSRNTLIDISKLTLPFKPYPYQIEDAKKIVTKKRALLGHEMGCGKTFISILVGMSINIPKLIICPESLRLNWKHEILKVDREADVQILLSNETPHFGEWTIVGYKTVSKFEEALKSIKCLFVDECQFCKAVNNWGKPSSKRAASVINLANEAEYCYLLSGTPEPSKNKDLFNILKMLCCEEFDFNTKWAFKHYADKFCDPHTTAFGVDYDGNSNSDELHTILSKIMTRRLKKDVLPDLKKQRQFIPIEAKFKSDYKDIERRLYFPNKNDTYMGLAMTGRAVLSKYKVDTAIDLADSLVNAGESVVIVTSFVDTMDKLIEHFGDKCCEIRGGMSDEEKQLSIDRFQNKITPVCCLSLTAGGVGHTLTTAHTMIVLDYDWLPANMIQVEDRICRTGQKEACMIYYIYCENSILDETFIETISDKSANIDIVVDNVDNTFDIKKEKETNATYLDRLKTKIEAIAGKKKTRRKRK